MKSGERSVIIIGLPGAGKTTVGRLIAARLGREFYDSDLEIEKTTGHSPARIITERGEPLFRSVERAEIERLMQKRGIVLAVGGGAPLQCSDLLRRDSVVILLTRELGAIAAGFDGTRPLTRNLSELEQKAQERAAVYDALSNAEIINEGVPSEVAERAALVIAPHLKARILVLDGPNLNMLGIREPEIYGSATYEEKCEMLNEAADERGIALCCRQSNHEGELIDIIQDAMYSYDGIVINPGAYTHYSYAICDALRTAERVPAIEVHISDIHSREEFRRVSVTAPVCIGQISGHGFRGYIEGIDALLERIGAV